MVEAVVIGGGPAGIAAAKTLAEAGKEVVVVERGDFPGSKNMFGGAIYTRPTSEIYPEFWKSAPVERCNTEHRFALLGNNDGTVVGYKNEEHSIEPHYNSFTVVRSKWDRWCAQQAEQAGAFIAPQTTVRELIKEDGKVVGIRTEQEEFRAKITIIADGVNSLLAKQAGLRKEITPDKVVLGVKEVIKLPKEVIEDRFHLEGNSGVIYTIVGGPMQKMLGLGFIYTNLNSVVVGAGVSLEELQKRKLKPYDILNELKSHPVVRPLIKDGELGEYSAHLIPEGGYNSMPQLFADGVMIAGDAAMLVNNVHWEGTNLAMMSGKYSALTAVQALNKGDYSSNMLSLYRKHLENSYVLKDLRTYKDVMGIAKKNADSFMGFYPSKINEFMNSFISVDGVPKSGKYRDFIGSSISERSVPGLIKDAVNFAKLAGGIIIR